MLADFALMYAMYCPTIAGGRCAWRICASYRSRVGAPLVASRIFLQAVNEKRNVREEVTSMRKAEPVAGLLHSIVGTARKPAVLASGASYVNCSQITGELDYQGVEATYSRGK
jgi:hypothetical protein